MTKTPDGRTIHVFHNRGVGDTNRLAELVAEKFVLQIFNLSGRLHWLDSARLIPLSHKALQKLISDSFASVRLVPGEDSSLSVAFPPLDLNDRQALQDVMVELVKKVAVAPSQPRPLSDHQKQEIKSRLAVGEALESVANYYRLSPAEAREVARAR
jgi:hypothetical protein